MIEDTANIVTLKILEEDREWAKDEQRRIKRATGVEPTQAELFSMMRRAYEASATQREQKIVELGNHSPEPVPQSIDLVLSTVVKSLERIEEQLNRLTTSAETGKSLGESTSDHRAPGETTVSAEAEVLELLEEVANIKKDEESLKSPRKRGRSGTR